MLKPVIIICENNNYKMIQLAVSKSEGKASIVKQEADTPASCKCTATAQENTECSTTKGHVDSAAIEITVNQTQQNHIPNENKGLYPGLVLS